MKYKIVLEYLPLPMDILEKFSKASKIENSEGEPISITNPRRKFKEEVFFETSDRDEIPNIIKKLIWQRAKNDSHDFIVKNLFEIDQKRHEIQIKFLTEEVQPIYYLVVAELMRDRSLGQKVDNGLVMLGALESGWAETRILVSDDGPGEEKKLKYYVLKAVARFVAQRVLNWDVKRIFKFKNGQRTEITSKNHPIKTQFEELQKNLNDLLAKNKGKSPE